MRTHDTFSFRKHSKAAKLRRQAPTRVKDTTPPGAGFAFPERSRFKSAVCHASVVRALSAHPSPVNVFTPRCIFGCVQRKLCDVFFYWFENQSLRFLSLCCSRGRQHQQKKKTYIYLIICQLSIQEKYYCASTYFRLMSAGMLAALRSFILAQWFFEL